VSLVETLPERDTQAPITPAAPAAPVRAPLLFSLGTKMLLATASLLLLSFGLCGFVTLSLAQRMLRSELEMRITRDTSFLAAASDEWIVRRSVEDKLHLRALAERLLDAPEILAVDVLDGSRHVVAHAGRPRMPRTDFFSLQVPIRVGARAIGSVRAWYSPVLALQEYWSTTGHLVILLFAGTFILFAIVLLAVNEWILSRPLQQFIRAMGEAESSGARIPFDENRRDEWGVLGRRLNQFLRHLGGLREQATVLYEASQAMAVSRDVQSSLVTVFTGLLHRYRLMSCVVFVQKPGAEELVVEVSAGLSAESARQLQLRPGEGLLGIVYASGLLREVTERDSDHIDPFLRSLMDRQQARAVLAVPLRAQGRVTGVAVYSTRQGRFTETEIQALSLFSDHVALALRNGRVLQDLQTSRQTLERESATLLRELQDTNDRLVRKVRELKTVYDLALATAASKNVEDIVRVMIGGIKELVEVQGAAFFLYDAMTQRLEPLSPAFDRTAAEAAAFACRAADSSLLERVVESGQAQIVNFVEAEGVVPAAWAALSVRSILALPLRQNNEVRGVFCVLNKVNGLFGEDDVRVLSLLTSRVTEVLHRLALDEQLRQQVHELGILQKIGERLPSPPVLTDTVAMIGRITRQELPGVDLCLFFVHHSASEALAMMGGDWDPQLTFDQRALTSGVSEKVPRADVFRETKAAFRDVGDTSSYWTGDDLLPAFHLEQLLYVPLVVEEGTIGVLALGSRQAGVFTRPVRALAELIARQVAIVIERSRLYERLRAANEKLEQINSLKNEFISMVSHELRTPLTTIKGFVSIVLNEETGPLNDQQRHFLETSDRAIDRLTLLVSDLLDISRIEAGQIKMQLRPISLRDVISRVVASFTPQFQAQGLTLTADMPEGLPLVLGDPDRLSQVFDNLLSNALKFTSKGGVAISAVDKGDYVMTSIRDSGQGIPQDEQDRIFEKFYQIKKGGGYPGKGTGLGLAIVRSIIDSHRGKIWVDSEPGMGADFRFLLPRARTEGEAPAGRDL
jgi:signal transduction histidine kinase